MRSNAALVAIIAVFAALFAATAEASLHFDAIRAAEPAPLFYGYHRLVSVRVAQEEFHRGESLLARRLQELDIWQTELDIDGDMQVILLANSAVEIQLKELNADMRILEANIQEAIQEERRSIVEKQLLKYSVNKETADPFFNTFRTLTEYVNKLNEWVSRYPSLLKLSVAGTSIEGRNISVLVFSKDNSADPNRPILYFEALQHAREWLAPSSLMFCIDSLLTDYVNGVPRVVNLLNAYDFHFMPIVNPDGYEYTWRTERLWRKNRRRNANGSYGVDLNRNWDVEHCGVGSSTIPSSDTYCGTAPFSEPETSTASKYIAANPRIRGAVDFHTYGYLILRPWQWTYTASPDEAKLKSIGAAIQSGIYSVHRVTYDNIQGSGLYPHSGGFIDWNYKVRGIVAYTLELRGNSFIVPDSEIVPTGQENYAGMLNFAEALL